MNDPVVTVTATVIDGTVVRWHRSLTAAANHRPAVSASRSGVCVHDRYLTDVPEDWLTAARAVYEALRFDRDAYVGHLATHRPQGFPNGPLEPVQRPAAPVAREVSGGE